MGNTEKKPGKERTKGMPSAVVLSVLIYVGLFFLAGAWVIIRVVPKKEPTPVVRVNRTKPIPLDKPQPPTRVNRNPTPPKSTPLVIDSELSTFQTPAFPAGSAGSRIKGGFEIATPPIIPLPVPPIIPIAQKISTGSDLTGVYYDFKRTRSGNYTGAGADTYREAVRNFLKRDWSTTTLSRFYRSPEKRYSTCMMLPTMSSSAAPAAFGEDPGSGVYWMIHYKGTIVHPKDITFRFWGVGDEFLVVRLDKKIVFADVWPSNWDDIVGSLWNNNDSQSKRYRLGHNTTMNVGDWITLKGGEPVDMEIAVGDNGGLAALMLLVEVEGVEYERSRQGGPILPAFKTNEFSHDLLDLIYKDLAPGEACLTNGPVFNDYASPDAEKKE